MIVQQKGISIIVPLYRGKRFVDQILQQIGRNLRYLNRKETPLQLILYNDFPGEKISVDSDEYEFTIEVINAEENKGIHGARVAALDKANGTFVLFLDQDDIIDEHYIVSQLSKIGSADAVVCRLVHGDKLHYTKYFRFEDVVTKEFMINHWCPIVSPGQVVLKKASIPSVWKENILKSNGADDYFLWLCMASENKKFVLNQEVLFHHVVNESNTSLNTNLMMDSEHEMINILLNKQIFTGEEKQGVEGLQDSLRRVHINELNNYRDSYALYDHWLNQVVAGKNPLDFFEKREIKSLAIYGAGEIGKSLYKLLRSMNFQDVFFIDRNAEYIRVDASVYTPENVVRGMDAVMIAINKEVDSVMENLKQKFSCPVYQIKEFLEEEN